MTNSGNGAEFEVKGQKKSDGARLMWQRRRNYKFL